MEGEDRSGRAAGGLDALHHRLPVFAASNTSRYLLAAALAFSTAAALGLDELLGRSRRGRLVMFAGIGAVVSLLVPVARGVSWSVPLALLWLPLLFAVGWRDLGRRARWALLIAMALLDLVPWGQRHLPRAPSTTLAASSPAIDAIRGELDTGGPWLVVGEGYTSYPSVLPLHGIADARPHNPIAHGDQVAVLAAVFDFDPVAQYFAPFRNVEHPLLDFLNVRVVVSKGEGRPPPGPSRQRRADEITRFDDDRFGDWRFYRNVDALPRFFLSHRSHAVDREELLPELRRLDDARSVTLLADEVPDWPARRDWPVGEVRVVDAEPGRVVLDVGGSGARLLATSLPHPSGWSARAGSERLRRLVVNGAFVAFQLGASDREVELRFRPPGLRLGFAVTLLSAAILALLIALPGRWRR